MDELPEHIVDCDADDVTAGGGFTTTVNVAEPEQLPVVPVTEYVVVDVGATFKVAPAVFPGIQV